ncbi:hypothetical protein BH09ACT5_BH09ACT5_07890 [soil metagenome]
MLRGIAHGIAYALARFWLATSAQSWRNLPTPSDPPLVHSPGFDPHRVLLLGSGIAVGYGVMSHDLALGGHLARELSALTGRGASVDIASRSDMSPSMARTTLAGLDLARFDALVLTLGGLEALTLLPALRWRKELRQLLEELKREAPTSPEVLLVETAAPLLAGLPSMVGRIIWRALQQLNRETAALCEEYDSTTFVPFAPAQGDVTTLTGRTTYRSWAELIAPAVARALDGDGRTHRPDPVDEAQRQLALDRLDIDSVPSDELQQIVATARDLLGATGASVTILDREHQKTKAAVGMPRNTIPRAASICDLTIGRAELLVVEDTMTDPRLAGTRWADGSIARFYAGYPVESPDGHRIGALCVIDRHPHTFSDTDAALLRQLALRVQAVLWGNSG